MVVKIDSAGLAVPCALDPGGEVGPLTLITDALGEVVLSVFKHDFVLPAHPSNLDALARTKRASQETEQMLAGAAVAEHIDGRGVYVVVLIVRRLFFQAVDEHLQIGFGNAANQRLGRVVIEIDHRESPGLQLSEFSGLPV